MRLEDVIVNILGPDGVEQMRAGHELVVIENDFGACILPPRPILLTPDMMIEVITTLRLSDD